MKVLYHLLYRQSVGADRWIAGAWQVGFEHHGHTFEFFDGRNIDAAAIHAAGADLFMADLCLLNAEDAKQLCKLRAMGTKVAIWVHWPLVPVIAHMTQSLVSMDIADVYFGEREPEGNG